MAGGNELRLTGMWGITWSWWCGGLVLPGKIVMMVVMNNVRAGRSWRSLVSGIAGGGGGGGGGSSSGAAPLPCPCLLLGPIFFSLFSVKMTKQFRKKQPTVTS